MSEKSKAPLFIGLGCLAVLVLGGCVVAGAFLFIANKASDTVAEFEESTQAFEEAFPVPQPTTPGAPVGSNLPAGWNAMRGPNWAFAVPSTWNEIPAPAGTIKAARSTDFTGNFAPNANLATEPYSGAVTSYATASVNALRTAGANVTSQSPSTVDGRSSYDVEAIWTAPGVPPYKTIQRYLVYSGTGYVVTCAASVVQFEQHRASCTGVINSFDLP